MNEEYLEYEEEQLNTNTSKCDSCGGELLFNPAIKMLECPFCGSTKEVDLSKFTKELDFATLLKQDNTWSNDTHVFKCVNCGAKEVLAKNEISTHCSFCGTSNVVEVKELSGVKPTGLLPFTIDKENASVCAREFKKKKLFAPNDFKKDRNQQDVSGIYSPVFTYDTFTYTNYSGKLGKRYTTTRRVNGKTVTSTHVRYFYISGVCEKTFDDVAIVASNNITQDYLDNLQPFDTNNSNKYEDTFLFGFKANQYTKDGVSCWNDAKKVINEDIKAKILSRYNYDIVSYISLDTDYDDITFKYLLLPIYVGYYNYKNKLYNFYVNGTTGKVTGKTPISIVKVSILILIIMIMIGICVLMYYNLK